MVVLPTVAVVALVLQVVMVQVTEALEDLVVMDYLHLLLALL
jgi:hypothetical protein